MNRRIALLASFLACAPALAQDGPPATVPANVSASSPTIGFTSPTIGFTSPTIGFTAPRIEFPAPPMTEEELALAPKAPEPPAPPPPPAVEGLAVTEEDGGVRYTLSADILFDFDKATLRPKATAALQAMSDDVRARFPEAQFLVEGYTDAKGSDAYNLKLSLRRAASVNDYLTATQGFAADSVRTEGRGETNPVAPNETPDGLDDPEGRQKNRRVEILVRPRD